MENISNAKHQQYCYVNVSMLVLAFISEHSPGALLA